jgi:hypothetical protein
MNILDDVRPSALAVRVHRRYEIVTSGGLTGALQAAALLQDCGLPVRDFSVDVREGVAYSALRCTVSMTADESGRLAEQLRAVPTVIAVDPI